MILILICWSLILIRWHQYQFRGVLWRLQFLEECWIAKRVSKQIPNFGSGTNELEILFLDCIIKNKNTFYIHLQIGTNLPQFLESHGQTQPFILVLGDLAKPEQIFVIVETEALARSPLLHAVDICFKLIYVLDVHFPWESQHTWDFLQKCIYELGVGKGRSTSVPAVTMLRIFLERKK